jgi:hypothetical protein
LNHEAEINGKTLIAHGGAMRIFSAASGKTKFGTSADGTGVKFGGNGDLRDALSIAVEIGDTT